MSEWLIDIIKEWVGDQGFLTTSYVDRGGPLAADFTDADLTLDSAWHELDLSAIVPEGAKSVALHLYWHNALVEKIALFRKHGHVAAFNAGGTIITVAEVPAFGDWTVGVDSDRKIDYLILAGGTYFLQLTVKGWWF